MKKIGIGIIVLFILSISFFWFFWNKKNTPEAKLKNLGYEINEIALLKKYITEEEINHIIQTKNTTLKQLIKAKDFEENHLTEYYQLLEKNQKLAIEDIILFINADLKKEYSNTLLSFLKTKDFQKEKIDRYLDYNKINQEAPLEDVVLLVNEDIDTITKQYQTSLTSFIKEPYFIANNLDRYLSYQKNKQTSNQDTIKEVNSNLDKTFYTVDKEVDHSKGYLILVNKYYKLSSTFVPKNLVTIESKYGYNYQMEKTAYEHFKEMCEAALKENMHLFATSPYRSYQVQLGLYNDYVARDGKAEADRYSARAGYSEHQTGLAVDLVSPNSNFNTFEETMEFSWMQTNAHKYGFILRYPKNKEYITGYMYEPWHYRYVGTEVATYIHENKITYEEYYAYFVENEPKKN